MSKKKQFFWDRYGKIIPCQKAPHLSKKSKSELFTGLQLYLFGVTILSGIASLVIWLILAVIGGMIQTLRLYIDPSTAVVYLPFIEPMQYLFFGIDIVLTVYIPLSIWIEYKTNTYDYSLARYLIDKILTLGEIAKSCFRQELKVAGVWKPYRIDFIVNEDINGKMDIALKGYMFIRSITLSGGGDLTAESRPNLAKGNVLLFVGNGNENLQILIYEKSFTKSLALASIDNIGRNVGGGRFTSQSLQELYTLVDESDDNLFAHQQLLNDISRFCDEPNMSPIELQIFGIKLEQGIVLATGIICNGKEYPLYDEEFVKSVTEVLGEPKLYQSLG